MSYDNDQFLHHTSCNECGSKDNASVYKNNKGELYSYCFSCSKRVNKEPYMQTPPSTVSKQEMVGLYQSCPILPLVSRGINQETCERYQVRTSVSTTDGKTPDKYLFPYFKNREVSCFKVASVKEKAFSISGDSTNIELFGQHLLTGSGKYLFITEGEIDCLSLYQVLKENQSTFEPQVVSVPLGAAGALKAITNNLEAIDNYEFIVICFDMDEPGKEAANKVAKLLSGKAKIASYPLKDCNEMLMARKSIELRTAVFSAKDYQPDSLVNGADLWDRYAHSSKEQCFPYPEEWTELNKLTKGYRLGSIVTVTAGSGSGKTQLLREIKLNMLRTTDWKIGDISLEEDISESQMGLVSLAMGKRLHLPEVEVPIEEQKKVFDELFSSRRVMFYDHFGGMEDDRLFTTIRYLGSRGYKAIFLDHLSIIVSEFSDRGGERERIDSIMTKLAKLAKEFKLAIFLVVHLRKTGSDNKASFEEGGVPSLDDLRGSGSLKQLSWDVLALSRNQQHDNRYCANTSMISVLKCRFSGGLGEADFLHYESTTGRMKKVPEPEGYR